MHFAKVGRCKAIMISGLICLAFLLNAISTLAADSKSVARVPLGSDGSQGSSTGLPDLFTGAMSYSVQIEVPAGRKGMDPGLALNYRSSNGSGWVGVGWELEVGAIQRFSKDGIDFKGNSYQIVRSGATYDLVDVGSNNYLPKMESDFSQIQQHVTTDGSIYWTVTDKIGTVFSYGVTAASRQDDPADASRIYGWRLDRVEDQNGNFMTLSYFKDIPNGQIYLEQINYTGNINGPLPASNYVKFHIDGPYNAPDMYTADFKVRTAYRLKTIEIGSNANQVRAYKLSYLTSGSTDRFLLSDVSEFSKNFGLDPNGSVISGDSLPVALFSYQVGSKGFAAGLTLGFDANRDYANLLVADVNGDSKTDLIHQAGTYGGQPCGAGQVGVRFSNGNGFNPIQCTGFDANRDLRSLLVADVNGDGKADLIYQAGSNGGTCGAGQVGVYFSNGNGFDPIQCTGFDANRDYANLLVADVNGDGKADLIHQAGTYGGQPCGAGQVGVRFSNGNGFNPIQCTGFDANRDLRSLLVADVNGDGNDDLIYQAGMSTAKVICHPRRQRYFPV